MLAHRLIDDICLPVFENIYILIIVLLCLFIYVFILYFLKFILSIFWRTTLETSVPLCALMCLSSVNIIFICFIMFYQINSLDPLKLLRRSGIKPTQITNQCDNRSLIFATLLV